MIDIDINKIALLGKQYIFDFIIARIKAEQKEFLYRVYVTDTLKAITQNTANFAGGSTMSIRYRDIIETSPNEPQRSSEEIISSICAQLGELEGKEDEK